MKKLLAFLTFLLFLLLLWFSWNWYRDTVVCCGPVAEETGVLYYDCNSELPKTTAGWESEKAKIIATKEEGKKLLVVGPYFDGEKKEEGLARAMKVVQLFKPDLTDDDFAIDLVSAGDCKTAIKDKFGKTIFKWVVRNEHVIEHHDKTYIYFRYDSDKPIDVQNVIDYLDKLAEDLKSSGQSVSLIGHTDADGTDEYNIELGMERAERVKKYLMSKGVSEDKISVASKGKREPIDTNGTPEGKQRNRRVEIQVK